MDGYKKYFFFELDRFVAWVEKCSKLLGEWDMTNFFKALLWEVWFI